MSSPTALFIAREGRHQRGLVWQPGLVVFRPGYVAFLGTGEGEHLALQLGLALTGVQTLDGRPRPLDPTRWLGEDGASLDAVIAKEALEKGFIWTLDLAAVTFSPLGRAGVPTAWVRDTDEQVTTTLPPQTPPEFLEPWAAWVKPPPTRKDLLRDARRLGCLGAVPLLPAGFLAWGAMVEDPWMWLGVAFWCLLPAVLLGLWLLELHRFLDHERLNRGLFQSSTPPPRALEKWPRIPEKARQAEVEPLPTSQGVPLQARTRGLLGALLDLGVVGVALGAGCAHVEKAWGWTVPPWIVLALPLYHFSLVAWLGGTLGQRLLGLRARQKDGGRLTVGRAALYVALLWSEFLLLIPCSFFAFIGFLLYARRTGLLPHERLSGVVLDWETRGRSEGGP